MLKYNANINNLNIELNNRFLLLISYFLIIMINLLCDSETNKLAELIPPCYISNSFYKYLLFHRLITLFLIIYIFLRFFLAAYLSASTFFHT